MSRFGWPLTILVRTSVRYPITEENPMRDHDTGAAEPAALQPPHDELQKQQGRFSSPAILREVGQNSRLFLAAERRISQNHLDAITLTDLRELEAAQRVSKLNVGASRPCKSRFICASRNRKEESSPPRSVERCRISRFSTVVALGFM